MSLGNIEFTIHGGDPTQVPCFIHVGKGGTPLWVGDVKDIPRSFLSMNGGKGIRAVMYKGPYDPWRVMVSFDTWTLIPTNNIHYLHDGVNDYWTVAAFEVARMRYTKRMHEPGQEVDVEKRLNVT